MGIRRARCFISLLDQHSHNVRLHVPVHQIRTQIRPRWTSRFPSCLHMYDLLAATGTRIVCKPCWRAVLDLSICWVCGECIVRGDEVVSLGWCFWHRGCFGCLLCGTRLDVPARITSSVCSESGRRESDAKGEWSKWDGSANEADNRNTTRRSNTFRRFLRSPGLGLCLDGNANTLSRERRSPWWGTVLTILPSGRVWLWL